MTIDGETVDEASFATKGNTSLSSVASNEDSNRYSFKINFGKYVEDQTYHGLDKLNLNNLYADATYMKDYLSYEIFRAAGVDAPLTSYVQLSVNGEALGLYLAIEEVDDSYLDRVYDGEGELYKPETEMLGNMDKFGGKDGDGQRPQGFGNAGKKPGSDKNGSSDGSASKASDSSVETDAGGGENKAPEIDASANAEGANNSGGWSMPEGMEPPEGFEPPEGMELPEGFEPPEGMDFPGGFGGFGSNDKGASLKYTDDELSSYSDIFDNAETGADEADEQRVVTALKQLSEGDVESSVDTDEVIRYFVAHNFVMSYDSYTGSMLHNYYLYENDGKLSMIPWDYNLAFGAFGGGGGGFGGGKWDKNAFGGKKGGTDSSVSATTPDSAGDDPSASTSAPNPSEGSPSASAMPSIPASDTQSEGTATANGGDIVAGPSNAAPDASSRDDATSVVNCGIDTPLSGAEEADRPMWAWIAGNEEYLERYHELYDELLADYFESGECKAEIERVRAMIEPYIKEESPAFYTVEEFETAVDTLEAFVEARAQSIRAQLDGTLSTKTSEQDASAKVDASGIKISAMGSQGGGR